MPISVAKEEKKVDYPLTQVSGTPLHQKLHGMFGSGLSAMNNQAIIAAANAAILVDPLDENRRKRKGAEGASAPPHDIHPRSTTGGRRECSKSLTWQKSLHNQPPRGTTRNQHMYPQDKNGNLTRGDPRKFSL